MSNVSIVQPGTTVLVAPTESEVLRGIRDHFETATEFGIVGNTCKYRTESGAKCAVGCVLPDELYDPRMDSGNASAVRQVLESFGQVNDYFANVDITVLVKLQGLHDSMSMSGLFTPKALHKALDRIVYDADNAYGDGVSTIEAIDREQARVDQIRFGSDA